MPGSRPRALEKSRSLPADALILDLEDAVAPSEKLRARELVAEAVRAGGYGQRMLVVRVNGADTEWGAADLEAACAAGPDGILLPKIEAPEQVARAAAALARHGAPERCGLWAMMETPRGILNAAGIAAAHPRLAGLVLGTNDLIKDLRAEHTPDRVALVATLGLCLLAARAEGLTCLDGVHNDLRDEEGLRAACVQGRALGFDGKTLIHPDQIAVANEIFAPTSAELDLAEAQIAAFEAAQARGEGVAVVEGRIVENLHVATARELLVRAAAIRELKEAS
jgi:citrate lyase beta subunit